MTSDPDLRHAISMRPHPFHLHDREHELQTPNVPASPATGSTFCTKGAHGAQSTSFEATTPDEEGQDPVARHTSAFDHDVEGRPQSYTSQEDPFGLSSKMKTSSEINLIAANTSRRREGGKTRCSVPLYQAGKGAMRAKKVQSFYEEQNENIERLLKSVDDHRRDAKEEEGDTKLKFKIAVYGSFVANVILAGLQLYAAARSGSLALFTTMADALFDPLSNVGLEVTSRMSKSINARRYPSGKARVETAGMFYHFSFRVDTTQSQIDIDKFWQYSFFKFSEIYRY